MDAICKRNCTRGAVTLLLVLCGLPSTVLITAQQPDKQDQNVWKKPKQEATPAPTGGRGSGRQRRPFPARPSVITLGWRLFRITSDGVRTLVDANVNFDTPDGQRKILNANDPFAPGDHLSLVVTVKQDGYLYVILNSRALFPNKCSNAGQTRVKKGEEYFVPSACTCSAPDAPLWFNLRPREEKDTLTFIFSRTEISDLPNAPSTRMVQESLIKSLREKDQTLTRSVGKANDQRTNYVDNKDPNRIIETLLFDKASPINTAGAAPKN